MHTLSTLFPAAFPALALSHFVALLSPGPDFSAGRLRRALPDPRQHRIVSRHRRRQCAVYCARHRRLGASAPGAAAFLLIELLGAGYLLWIGSLLIRSRPATLAMESRSRSASGVRQAAAAGAGVIAAQPQKRPVLSGADDFPARAGCDPASANGERAVDGQRGVLLGFTAGERDCAAADTAPPGAIVWRVERAAGAILMLFGLGIIWRFLHDLAVRLYA